MPADDSDYPFGLGGAVELFDRQMSVYVRIVRGNSRVSEVLAAFLNQEDWVEAERIFWAFQFGYLLGSNGCIPPRSPSGDEEDVGRGYQ